MKTFLGNDLELREKDLGGSKAFKALVSWQPAQHSSGTAWSEIIDHRWAVSCLGFPAPGAFEHPETQNHRHEAAVYEAAPEHYATRVNCEKQKSIWEPIYSPFSSFFTSNSFSLPLERSRLIPQITSAFRGIVGHKTELKFSCKRRKPGQLPWRKQTLTSGGLSSDLCCWTAVITGSHIHS